MSEISLFHLSPYILLFLCVILNLVGGKEKFIAALLLLVLPLAFFTQTVTGWAFLYFLMLPITLFVWVNHHFADLLRKICFFAFLILGFLLASHSLSGVQNFKVFDQVVFGEGMAPFNMFFNFDRVYLAVVMFMMLPPPEKIRDFKYTYFSILKYFVVALITILPIALFTGYIHPHFNTNPYLAIWALNNLLFVCFSEEVIFRRFIQTNLMEYFRNTQYGDLVSIFIGAIAFGLAHWAGGYLYVGMATIAGILYGLCYYQSWNIRSSMTLHFLVNLSHALFFTYPFAA
jgi:uncharacterized protein